MPGAGFYSIHASRLQFASDGCWYADGEPVTHKRLARFFSRYVRRKVSGGYEIWVDERYHADIEVEDTPYVVTASSSDFGAEAHAVPGGLPLGFMLHLNDGTTERLDPSTLHVGAANVLYCRVKAGTERARFLRPAYYQLAQFIEEVGGGHFQLRCGGATYAISQH